MKKTQFEVLDNETKLRPIPAAVEFVTGNRPSPPTSWRWRNTGCKGIKLPFKQVGGVPMTCYAWVRKWLDDVTAAAQNQTAPSTPSESSTQTQSARQRKAAERLAKEVG